MLGGQVYLDSASAEEKSIIMIPYPLSVFLLCILPLYCGVACGGALWLFSPLPARIPMKSSQLLARSELARLPRSGSQGRQRRSSVYRILKKVGL
jgi:hypothetical protein